MIIKDTKLTGLKSLIENIINAGKPQVLVGVPASENRERGDGITMAELAAIHEWGAPSKGIPERSFLRSAIIEGRQDISDLIAQGVSVYLQQGKEVDLAFYNRVGLFASNLVKTKIAKGPFKPLSEATIKRKGSSLPLVDTGALRQSITYVVR